MKLNKVQLKDGRWVEQYMRDACDRCVLNDGGSCQHREHPKLAGIDCSQRQWRFCDPQPKTLSDDPNDYIKVPCDKCTGCVFGDLDGPEGCSKRTDSSFTCCSFANAGISVIFKHKHSSDYAKPEPETPKKKVYPNPADCVKIPCDTCEGCVFGNMRTVEDCHHSDRTCGASHNPVSMIYVLKTDDRAKSTLSWDNGIHYMVAECGCVGCCFSKHCSALKPSGYPDCNATDSPLKMSSQFRAHKNPCAEVALKIEDEVTEVEFEEEEVEEDPINLDNEYELDEGGVVQAIRQGDSACGGCYFRKSGRCEMARELAENPDCTGIIFLLIEDPPSKVEDEEEDDRDETKIDQIVTDKYGDHYKAFEYEDTCRGCAFNNASGDCVITDFFVDEPDCGSVIFKLVDDEGNLHNPDDDDDDEYLPEDDQVPVGGTITVDGNVYVSTKDPWGPGSITSCEACDLDGDNCPGALERCMCNTHFKLFVGLNPPDSKPIVGELIFRKETKYSL
jgi:hypothetical protein